MGPGLCTFGFLGRLRRTIGALAASCGVLACFVVLMSLGRAAPNHAPAPQHCELIRLGRDEVIKHGNWVRSASFSPDGSKVITGSADGSAIIKDLKTGKETRIQHGNWVNSASFSPDGSKVIVASDDGTAIVMEMDLDLKTGRETEIRHGGEVNSASFSPDSSKVVTASA